MKALKKSNPASRIEEDISSEWILNKQGVSQNHFSKPPGRDQMATERCLSVNSLAGETDGKKI